MTPIKKNTQRVCVLGAGFMGCVISVIYKRCGYDVVICDNSEGALDSFIQRALPIARIFDDLKEGSGEFLDQIGRTTSLKEAASGVALIHEVVQEDLGIKKAVVKEIEGVAPKEAIIATNTSSYLISDVASQLEDKSRLIGIHFVTPAHLIRAIEIIYSDFTRRSTIAWAKDFVASLGYVGIVCRERPGFIVNRLQFALLSEAHKLVDEGYAAAEDIDAAVRLSIGPRLALWGPLLTEDLVVNKKTALAVAETLGSAPEIDRLKFHIEALRKHVAAGTIGAIGGQGWYEWSKPYEDVVHVRDSQLKLLLDWLDDLNPVAEIGIEGKRVGVPT